MNIRFLGAHNSESRTTSCVCLLIDDTLAIDAGGLTSNLSLSGQQRLDAILLTHQHYDHIKDIPGIALNLSLRGASVKVYATADVRAIIEDHWLNGRVYPKFQELPLAKPALSFNDITPYAPQWVNGHGILPIPVNHTDPTVGYQISDARGNKIFYTSDTGPGLSDCWRHTSPQLLIVDVTLPDACEEFARQTGHLTPKLLEGELVNFRKQKGYLPRVITVHMDTGREAETREEIAAVAWALNTPITVAREGMELHI